MYSHLPKVMNSSLLSDFQKRILSFCYGNFRTAYRSHVKDLGVFFDCLTLQDVTKLLFRNIDNKL